MKALKWIYNQGKTALKWTLVIGAFVAAFKTFITEIEKVMEEEDKK